MHEVAIRPITYDDTANIIRWRNSDSVRKRFIYQGLFTKESHENWMKTMVETGKVVQFIISCDGEDVGSVYLRDVDYEKKEAEYGIFIGEESARGCGVGTRSAELIIEYAFETMGLERLFLRVHKDNERAVKSYEKAGFEKDGRSETVVINGCETEVIFMSLENKSIGAKKV